MKFLKAVCCLLVASIVWYISDICMGLVPGSWTEVVSSLLSYCVLLGIIWLLVFLPLLFFTRRFETWGWLKAGVFGSLVGGLSILSLLLVLWWLGWLAGPGGVSGTYALQFGLGTGLLFAFGTIISRERWAHNLGRVVLWTLAIGCGLIAFLPHQDGTLTTAARRREGRIQDRQQRRTRDKLTHGDLSWFPDNTGQKQPIRSVVDWQRRRADVLAQMQSVMGPLPRPEKPVPLDMQIEERLQLDDGLTRRKVAYQTDSTHRRVRAYLFVPPRAGGDLEKRPAILCLHQTTAIGKDQPAGLGGNPNLHYALHLARRGYVTLTPDYPSFGEYPYTFPAEDGYISGTMKAVYDNVRALDLLESLDEVDASRIGCIGHSLGGHNTMITAAFDPRIRVLVSNCGFTRMNRVNKWEFKVLGSPRYMPLIQRRYGHDPDKVPFDFPEIVASFAPRPFLASAPVGDDNFDVTGVWDCLAAARPIYGLYGAEASLRANYPDCDHDFPEPARQVAYEFLDQHLKAKPKSD